MTDFDHITNFYYNIKQIYLRYDIETLIVIYSCILLSHFAYKIEIINVLLKHIKVFSNIF